VGCQLFFFGGRGLDFGFFFSVFLVLLELIFVCKDNFFLFSNFFFLAFLFVLFVFFSSHSGLLVFFLFKRLLGVLCFLAVSLCFNFVFSVCFFFSPSVRSLVCSFLFVLFALRF